MEMFEQPVEGKVNRLVVTKDRAYFAPYSKENDYPRTMEMLSEIFDLGDPDVAERVREDLLCGGIRLGYYDPSEGELFVHSLEDVREFLAGKAYHEPEAPRSSALVYLEASSILDPTPKGTPPLHDSPHIDETDDWPDTEGKAEYVRDLRRMRHLMSKLREGHDVPLVEQSIERLRERYPLAYETFREEAG